MLPTTLPKTLLCLAAAVGRVERYGVAMTGVRDVGETWLNLLAANNDDIGECIRNGDVVLSIPGSRRCECRRCSRKASSGQNVAAQAS